MIYFFMMILFLIFILMIFMKLSMVIKNMDKEKLISFECGFNSFFLPRSVFSIQFFKILLIFLFFDMEVVIVLPLMYLNLNLNLVNILIFLILFLLILGLFIEMWEGSLEWVN